MNDMTLIDPTALALLREKAAQKRPPPIWVPTEPGEVVEGEIVASTRPMRGSQHCYTATENEITVMQPDGEPVTVQVYGWMGHDMAVADAGIGSLIHIEYLGMFPGTFGKGRYRRFAIAVLNDEGRDDD